MSTGASASARPTIPRIEPNRFSAVAIGSSTGGPRVLEQIIASLPADLPVPIFIAQHMPPRFTESFSVSLDQMSALSVVHAEDGMPIFPGVVYVARGQQHMRIVGSRHATKIQISQEPRALLFKPSADELLRSTAQVYGRATLAVVLSGIGRDGSEGARAVRAVGGMILTQAAETCAVYGMPKTCVELGLSDAALEPTGIRQVIHQLSPSYVG